MNKEEKEDILRKTKSLGELKHWLSEQPGHPSHLSNLPGWFWEDWGDVITSLENLAGVVPLPSRYVVVQQMNEEKKQQTAVKLYTEADLKKVISIYSEEYKTSTDEILKELNLTPIELPTDKQIEDESLEKNNDDLSPAEEFQRGAEYIINKIQGNNK